MRDTTIKMLLRYYESLGLKKEEKAKDFIRANIAHPCAVGVSWGKDSVVSAFLCLPFLSESDWIFSVSAGRYNLPTTDEVRDTFLDGLISVQYKEFLAADYFDIGRAFGLTDVSATQASKIRGAKKTDMFQAAIEGAQSRVWGLRADESGGRRRYARSKGPVSFNKNDGLLVLSPILHWTWLDVWSVIIANKLPYCAVYDKYDEIGGLAKGRSGSWAGTRTAQYGRIAYLRRFYPYLYNELVEAFPEVRAYV